jgi:acetyltransferase
MTIGRDAALRELFAPRSVAVIGASNRPGTVGSSLFRNLLQSDYRGAAYPVNPAWTSVNGVRCYPDAESLPEVPDLGIVAVPASDVAGVAEELGRAGTKGLVVISSGFREMGGAGVAREEELVRAVRRHRMSLVGPNCFGVLNTNDDVRLNATFSDGLPPPGSIAFVSQSGALCSGILRLGVSSRVGFSRFLSLGNRAGVDESDALRALADDDATKVILLYIEELADGRRFLEVARELTERKPVLVVKSGRSAAEARPALTIAGRLAAAEHDRLYDSVFEQAGVIRVDSTEELFRAGKVFASGMRLDGPRVVVLTNSGGPGIVATDAAERHGLKVPPLTPSVHAQLVDRLPPSTSLNNPVDMTADGSPAQFEEGLRVLLASPELDGAIVITTAGRVINSLEVADAVIRGHGRGPKPVVACLFGLSDLSHEVIHLEQSGIPAFTFPEEAALGLAQLARYAALRDRARDAPRTFAVDRHAVELARLGPRHEEPALLPEDPARALVTAYGLRFPPSTGVRSAAEAVAAAAAIGYPVALKACSPDFPRPPETGSVALGLAGPEAVRAAWASVTAAVAARTPGARPEGCSVQAMAPKGKEVVIAALRHPVFGPVVLFGGGGAFTEVLRDVTFRCTPITPVTARRMVRSVRASALLAGVRGEPPSDIAAVGEAIERVAQLLLDDPQILEVELNPVIVGAEGEGVTVVDARVVLGPAARPRPA